MRVLCATHGASGRFDEEMQRGNAWPDARGIGDGVAAGTRVVVQPVSVRVGIRAGHHRIVARAGTTFGVAIVKLVLRSALASACSIPNSAAWNACSWWRTLADICSSSVAMTITDSPRIVEHGQQQQADDQRRATLSAAVDRDLGRAVVMTSHSAVESS